MIRVFFSYWIWHYTEGFKELWVLFKNFLGFLFHFFSIRDLTVTIFAPWLLIREHYKGGLDISSWFGAFIITTVMRFVGFFIKAFIIFFGLFLSLCLCVVFAFLTICWTFLPIVLCLLLIGCLKQIV